MAFGPREGAATANSGDFSDIPLSDQAKAGLLQCGRSLEKPRRRKVTARLQRRGRGLLQPAQPWVEPRLRNNKEGRGYYNLSRPWRSPAHGASEGEAITTRAALDEGPRLERTSAGRLDALDDNPPSEQVSAGVQPFGQPLVKPHSRGQRGPGYYNVGGLWPSTTPRTSEGRATTILGSRWDSLAVGTIAGGPTTTWAAFSMKPRHRNRRGQGYDNLGCLWWSATLRARVGRDTTTWAAFGEIRPRNKPGRGDDNFGGPCWSPRSRSKRARGYCNLGGPW